MHREERRYIKDKIASMDAAGIPHLVGQSGFKIGEEVPLKGQLFKVAAAGRNFVRLALVLDANGVKAAVEGVKRA
jgi:hypothetical protein